MTYITWLAIGVGCGVIEVVTMGFWFLWLALSALLVSLLTFFGLIETLPAQIVIFGLLTTVFIVVTRPLVLKVFKTNDVKSNVDALIGQTGIVIMDIIPPHTGQINLQGQVWTARSRKELAAGTHISVEKVEGVTLTVSSIEE